MFRILQLENKQKKSFKLQLARVREETKLIIRTETWNFCQFQLLRHLQRDQTFKLKVAKLFSNFAQKVVSVVFA